MFITYLLCGPLLKDFSGLWCQPQGFWQGLLGNSHSPWPAGCEEGAVCGRIMNAASLCDQTQFYDKRKLKKFWRSQTNHRPGQCAVTASVFDWNCFLFMAAVNEQSIVGS